MSAFSPSKSKDSRTISGAIYWCVPVMPMSLQWIGFANPKSQSLIV
jgi:hypothetical protein